MFTVEVGPLREADLAAIVAERVEIAAVMFAGLGRQAALVLEVTDEAVDPVCFSGVHGTPSRSLEPLQCPGDQIADA